MPNNKTRLLAAAAALLVAAAGCGSSSKSTTGTTAASGASGGAKKTITIGILTDASGLAASGNKTTVQGVQAGATYAARNGYTIKYDVGDTGSSAAGALTAAQQLVQQDHVLAVIAVSAFAYGGAQYLATQGIPVIGVAEDASEWQQAPNMFSTYGAIHTDLVNTTGGQFMKMQGVTSVGAIGYGISPQSSNSARAFIKAGEAVGLKDGYLDYNFPFGSTNVGPQVIAMKNAGVDGLYTSTDPNTGFALIAGMRQAGANLKVALLPTGYGGDLLQAGPGALQAAQNVYFFTEFQPVEMHTAATQQFQSDLAAAGVTSEPTYAEYAGYTSIGLLVQGLKAAGSSPTHTTLIGALSAIHDWNALGLLGSIKLDINDRATIISPGNCIWVVKLVGSAFQLVPNADPICGTVVPGATLPSS